LQLASYSLDKAKQAEADVNPNETPGSAIEELGATITRLAEQLGPAIIGLGRGWHGGSGVVVGEGLVLTAAHNLKGDEATVTFADGRRHQARVSGVDAHRDLAVLATDTNGQQPVEWSNSDAGAAIGTPVVALANPGGRGLRVTPGFVSATDRSFRGGRGRRVTGCIEHTAPLPRGSSGSPIVSLDGKLLGLNAIRLEGGLIVAVPAVRERVESLSRGESPRPPRLGVAVAPPHVARRLRRAVGLPEREGVLVRAVEDSSPAAQAGIEQGDLIVAAAGRPMDGVDALYATLDRIQPGESLPLTTVRGTDERELTISFNGNETKAGA
jgi:serine protease Do